MKHWSVQDAKARFSEFLRASLRDGPQMVTLRGEEAAVMVPAAEWRRLNGERKQTLKDLLLGDDARSDLQIGRRQDRMREPLAFED